MSKSPNFLKRKMQEMQERFSLGSTMTKMALSFLPQFTDQLAKMEKPESEGGLLKEGEDKMAFILTQHNGEMIVTVSSLTFLPDKGQMLVNKPISNRPLAELLNQQNEEHNGAD